MMLTRRSVTVGSAALATTALVLGPEAMAAPRRLRKTSAEGGQVVLDWEQVAYATIYGPPTPTPIPIGAPVLGFVSVAAYRAATRSAHLGSSSESAAVARAAHDVLLAYYPAKADALGAALAASLDAIGPGHARTKGSRIGADAAREMIASRQGDGYLDGSIHYTKAPGPGVWTPNTGQTDMLGAWLGSLRPLVVAPEPLSGPYALGSSAWVADYEEVRALGRDVSTDRTPTQTASALFHNSTNAVITVSSALARYLEDHPIGIIGTAHIFAMMHAAVTDSIICTWRAKRDVGFWRPFQAISGPYVDGNPGTTEQPGWVPLVPNPNYSDYLSGHASGTSPQVEVIRRVLGENTALELRSPTLGARTYSQLSEIEFEAFGARIWGGLHYRKAMTDTYEMGHRTAVRVMSELG